MAASIEIESKALISQEDYSKILKHYEFETSKEYDQTNHYIDTPEFTLKQLGIGLRVRIIGSNYVLTLKAPLAEGLYEKDQIISKEEFQKLRKGESFPEGIILDFVRMFGVDPTSLKILAKLTTHRVEVEIEKINKRLCIDKNVYNQITDYELELQANTLDSGKVQLKAICDHVGITYNENFKSKQSRAMESIA